METIRPEQLKAVDSPTNMQVPSYDSDTQMFNWADAGVGGGHVIQDEGTPLTNRANLNFVGNGITASDDAGNDTTVVTISGIITDHAALSNLGYAGAGHTGFEPTVTKGNLTASSPIVFDQTRQVIGGAAVVSIPQATTIVAGYLSATDWNTFNGKLDTVALADLTDVNIAGVEDSQSLVYDTDTSMWIPATISGMAILDGEGVVNQVAFWSDVTTLSGNAALTFTPATNELLNVGIISSHPTGKAGILLDPNSATWLSGDYSVLLSPPVTLTANRRVTFPNAALTFSNGGTLTLGGNTLTVADTGTAALKNVANTFTQSNTFRPTAGTATFSIQDVDGGSVLVASTYWGMVCIGDRVTPAYTLDVEYDTTSYWLNNIIGVARFARNCNDYPTSGFGESIIYALGTNVSDDRVVGTTEFSWADATDATRRARVRHTVYDTAEREGFRIEASGSQPMIGFLGADAVQRAAHIADPTGGGTVDAEARAAINALIDIIENLGLSSKT